MLAVAGKKSLTWKKSGWAQELDHYTWLEARGQARTGLEIWQEGNFRWALYSASFAFYLQSNWGRWGGGGCYRI